MDNLMAYCGLQCNTCPIHMATLEPDFDKQKASRKSIAEFCNKHYNMNLKPADITDCDGCKANTGRLFSGCVNCEIRKCAIRNNLENCAFCEEYPCSILLNHFSIDTDAKNRLDKIRQNYLA